MSNTIKFIVENDKSFTALNHEVTVELPDKLPKAPTSIELLDFNADISYQTITQSNHNFKLIRDGTTYDLFITQDFYSNSQALGDAIETAIRNAIGQFNPGGGSIDRITVSVLSVSRFDEKKYRNRLVTRFYRFTANDSVPFQLDFSSEHSVGQLIGFGSVVTDQNTIIESSFSTNIDDKLGIRTWNVASPTGFYYNVRMGFINNSGTKVGYATFTNTFLYTDVSEFTTAFSAFMNGFAGALGITANILVSYSLDTKCFTIEHTNSENFGFYFDISQYGFIDSLLGFNKFKSYQNRSKYTGIPVPTPPIIDKEDYFYITSDLINKGTAETVFLASASTYKTPNNILFHIPVSNKYLQDIRDSEEVNDIGSNLVSYREDNNQKISITSSRLYRDYLERKGSYSMRFSLKTGSGLGISTESKWQLTFLLHFD